MVVLEEAKTFLNAVRSITGSVATVDDGDHYGMFVAHLETLFIKFCKKLYPSILDSKEIIQSILKKKISPYSALLKLLFILFTLPV